MPTKIKLLYVEDNFLDQKAFIREIKNQSLPYEAIIVDSISKAKETLARESFDVILIDHQLLDGDGFSLLPHVGETPALMVAGQGNEDLAVRALKAGANDYIVKDVERTYLQVFPVRVDRAYNEHKAASILKKSEGRFRAAMAACLDSFYVLDDSNGQNSFEILDLNQKGGEMLDQPREALIGQSLFAREPFLTNKDKLTKLLNNAISQYEPIEQELMFHYNNGDIWFSVQAVPLGEEIALIVRDITKRKQDEELLRLAKEKAEMLNEQKSELMSVVSHDLKNPLSAIDILVNMLKEDLKSSGLVNELEDCEDSLNVIAESANYMLQIVRRLTNSNRIELEGISLKLEERDLTEIVKDVIKINEPKARAKQISISFASVPNSTARLDQCSIWEMVDNLISNAVKYSPPGKQINVQIRYCDDTKESLRFSVKDEGPGLSDEDQALAFQKFQKLTPRPTAGESSSGLGLSIVKEIAEQHNGSVSIESKQGEGATFSVILPVEPNLCIRN